MTAIATKPASVLRTYTQQVRDHAAAMQRLQDQYLAALKRAEAQYFAGAERVMEAVRNTVASGATPEAEAAPEAAPQAASA